MRRLPSECAGREKKQEEPVHHNARYHIDCAASIYNVRMRFSIALLLPFVAFAQQNVIPPPLRQAAALINDFGNNHRYAAEEVPRPSPQRPVSSA